MAGTYQDVPGQKRAYDIDGTIVNLINSAGVPSAASGATIIELNDYDSTIAYTLGAGGAATTYVSWIFPQTITLRGLWGTVGNQSVGIGSDPSWGTEYSLNTTDGVDGTWTTLFANSASPTWATHGLQSSTASEPQNRSDIKELSSPITDVIGVRVKLVNSNTKDSYLRTMYWFGEHDDAPSYLEFWHPTLDQPLDGAHFDWGNTTLDTDATKEFRIKNTHPTDQAHDCELLFDTLVADSPSPTTWHTASDDDITYTTVLTLGHIPADTITGTLYLKRETPLTATLGLTELRIIVTTTGFG
jgi:hypothetical protein